MVFIDFVIIDVLLKTAKNIIATILIPEPSNFKLQSKTNFVDF